MMRDVSGQEPNPGAGAYRLSEAAQFLWVKEHSLRRWAMGASDRHSVIHIADAKRHLISFNNLAELHVLSFLRDQKVPLQRIRRAVRYITREFAPHHPHPLLAMDLATDGAGVFVEQLVKGSDAPALVDASRDGQLAMRDLLLAHLKRLDRDESTKEVRRLYPFAWRVRSAEDAARQPMPVLVDPRISFGRPVIAGTRVPIAELASRFAAGEPMFEIAEDMDINVQQVEQAIRFYTHQAA